MDTIRNSPLRLGNFTSSNISDLLSEGRTKGSHGKPFYTLIKKKQREARLERSLDSDSNARPLIWGKAGEKYVFGNPELMGLDYKISSQVTIQHPDIPQWRGSPEGEKYGTEKKTIFEIKCPYTMTSFCDLVESKTIQEIRDNCELGERYYWQSVSNLILTGADVMELIIFCPYKRELEAIREVVRNGDDPSELYKYYWIANSNDEELPYLPDDCTDYKNINIISFTVPESDRMLLTQAVKDAVKLLMA